MIYNCVHIYLKFVYLLRDRLGSLISLKYTTPQALKLSCLNKDYVCMCVHLLFWLHLLDIALSQQSLTAYFKENWPYLMIGCSNVCNSGWNHTPLVWWDEIHAQYWMKCSYMHFFVKLEGYAPKDKKEPYKCKKI